MGGCGPGRGLA
ncbi:unnamed protein product [Gulo gulo]|uniref:Uncharacterized protein n=1 Tax=Gulo gulo TaxID=48420 RepID=A0A9X9M6V8_GULGU|nr:unnamed protein product [Gulo gulo]